MSQHLSLFPPWDFTHWEQVDDSVRGGSSVSHLEPNHPHELSPGSSDEKACIATFHGTLDIKTLGGAGFASQRYPFSPPLSIPSSNKGLILRLSPTIPPASSSPTRFTITLGTTPRTRLPSGRTESRLQYEADFEAPVPRIQEGFSSEAVEVILPFENFEATYRGRRVERSDEKWRPLRTDEIFDISVMCRSGFGEQEGEFALGLLAVEAYGHPSSGWWGRWSGWWNLFSVGC